MTDLRVRPTEQTLTSSDLYAALSDPALESMNFLNEVAGRYPAAISFAAGRPYEEFFSADDVHRYLDRFREHLRERGYDERRINTTLLQYGRTKGIIADLVARNLALDEGIEVDAESIVVTVGCQEAMYLVLRALRTGDRDALLVVSPNYVGITGAAQLVDMPVVPVRDGPDGVDLDDLRAAVARTRSSGLRPRALYLVPDYANPSGARLTVDTRLRLLAAAEEHGLLLLEDNPYGLFHDGTRIPTLKALDSARQVIYLGSFAKTGMPGARVGYVVADQAVHGGARLADELAKIKSMLTVNTSPLAQAVIGGKLLTYGCSLVAANEREAAAYRRNLAAVLDGLAARFPDGDVTWNAPTGGFFVVLTVPFEADDALLEYSARRHGVLWTPMRHFSADRDPAGRQIRLSVSLLTPAQIETGLDRLAALFAEATAGPAA
ncbi:aminotransferase-like domain-containing protein [Phytohabitans rumicis]|uniref:GntR family transcriptional regulator n=2 Tax=Phytohabitans rumicis TaxID=1076125 RepID=A0A6V8LG83_9ACTN|nr:PLP-dependent aminotransferase family protein [Phytohabitans rumicis]GFJ91645.1 GntR family transcriptional regulator [Phytohabitans rumicis]